MEQTRIELSRLKILRDKNEAKKQELESKVVVPQQHVIDIQNQVRAIEVQNKKTLQVKKRKLNKLQMEFIMANKKRDLRATDAIIGNYQGGERSIKFES